jgi:hypothetical protein
MTRAGEGGTDSDNRLERAIQLVDVGEDVFKALFAAGLGELINIEHMDGGKVCVPWRFPQSAPRAAAQSRSFPASLWRRALGRRRRWSAGGRSWCWWEWDRFLVSLVKGVVVSRGARVATRVRWEFGVMGDDGRRGEG